MRPDGYYGLSKAFGENLARFYFDRYGIETVCLRIGSSFPEPKDRRMLATWLSYDDLERLVVASSDRAGRRATASIYGMSDNTTTLVGQHHGGAPRLPAAGQLRSRTAPRSRRASPRSTATTRRSSTRAARFVHPGPVR